MSAQKKPINQNLTVPNALSLLRIILVPFFARSFLTGHTIIASIVLALSGLSDCLDGWIARRFNQVTELGKMLDPLADKLTQGVVAICLGLKFPVILPLLLILVVKELGMLICGALLIQQKKKPTAAAWYGKVATVMFYCSAGAIVVMNGVFHVEARLFRIISVAMLTLTAVMMIYAAVRYFQVFLEIWHSDDEKYRFDLPEEIRTKRERAPRE